MAIHKLFLKSYGYKLTILLAFLFRVSLIIFKTLLKKSTTNVTKGLYRQYGVSLCNKLQRELSSDRKKFKGKSEKKRNKCNKCIL